MSEESAADKSSPAAPRSLTELFERDAHWYMSIGMTYQEYWHGDVWAIVDAQRAYKLQMERKNQELWLQGMYIYEAIADISPILHAFAKQGTKPHPYRDKPYKLFGNKEDEKEREQIAENERLKAILYFQNWARANQK